jgi:hypothetical protein
MHRVRRAERLTHEDHLAHRSRTERQPRLAGGGLVAARFQHELELVAAVVIARDREGVALHQRRRGIERELRDRERLVHRGELPGQDVQRG